MFCGDVIARALDALSFDALEGLAENCSKGYFLYFIEQAVPQRVQQRRVSFGAVVDEYDLQKAGTGLTKAQRLRSALR